METTNTKFTVNLDVLPDFEVEPNIPVTSWQEQLPTRDPLLKGVIEFAIRVARLTQAAVEVDKKPIEEIVPWAVLIADTIGISGHGFYCASRWLAYFWSYRDDFAAWFNSGQPEASFVPSQDLIRALTKSE